MTEKYANHITNTLDDQQHLIFYHLMRYEVPHHSSYFLFEKKWWKKGEEIVRNQEFPPDESKFSREKKNPNMDDFIALIKKYRWLYRSIPFIQSIYLCNSITFNALHQDSDIDIFIVAKKWAIRRARLWSVGLFFLFGLKRGKIRGSKKKFCLSFYVTHDHQNLYDIMLPQNDIYFIYRLAHLVPLYQERQENIYKQNTRLQSALPNFPWRHCIDIWLTVWYGKSNFKKTIEFISGWILGKGIEIFIRFLRLPIVLFKTKKLKGKGWGVIVNDNILKFHRDIRKKIHLLYIMHKRKINRQR